LFITRQRADEVPGRVKRFPTTPAAYQALSHTQVFVGEVKYCVAVRALRIHNWRLASDSNQQGPGLPLLFTEIEPGLELGSDLFGLFLEDAG